MLTSGQCQVVAYLTEGDVLCLKCGQERIEFDEDEYIADAVRDAGLRGLIQYELDSNETWNEEGLSCGNCGEVLVEPYAEEPEQDEEAEEMNEWGVNNSGDPQ